MAYRLFWRKTTQRISFVPFPFIEKVPEGLMRELRGESFAQRNQRVRLGFVMKRITLALLTATAAEQATATAAKSAAGVENTATGVADSSAVVTHSSTAVTHSIIAVTHSTIAVMHSTIAMTNSTIAMINSTITMTNSTITVPHFFSVEKITATHAKGLGLPTVTAVCQLTRAL